MNAVIEARGLGKRYRSRWALAECTLSIPAGRVVGLVGPNGAGKSTFLNLVTGMLSPDAGSVQVLGTAPAGDAGQLARVGFVAQDAPTYAGLTIADHLKLGTHLNPAWDGRYAAERIASLGLDPRQKAGKMSGGQRAQLALTMAIAKRPKLLILDEPVAAPAHSPLLFPAGSGSPSDRRRPGGGRQLAGLVVDIGAPIAVYYLLHGLGTGNLVALGAGAALPALSAGYTLASKRRLDGVALFVLATILASILVSVTVRDPRLLLAKDGLITGLWGLWFLGSVRARRPPPSRSPARCWRAGRCSRLGTGTRCGRPSRSSAGSGGSPP